MSPGLLREIVEAVLYEGYVLYPYRASAKKNQRERFTFGRVYPKAYSQAQNGAEPFMIQTQCLVRAAAQSPRVDVSVGFLQPSAREIGLLKTPGEEWIEGVLPDFTIVPELRVEDEWFQTWHEAVERIARPPALALGEDSPGRMTFPFGFIGSRAVEPIRDGGRVVGVVHRRQEAIEGVIELSAEPVTPQLHKVTVRVLNHSPLPENAAPDDEAVLVRIFASTHTILTVHGGEFVSLMDPAAEFKAAVAGCKNIGTWPVLIGDEGRQERDTMLSSPIVLYDYPKIAPESPGPLFDGTEIDEILTLRVLTMTEEEKREVCGVDEHARRLLERAETLPQNSLLRMHGTLRPPQRSAPVEFDDFFGAGTRLKSVSVAGVCLRPGDRVRLRPKNRADVMDLALGGQTATIEAIEQDLEQQIHLAVVLENDPGKDLGLLRQPGHRFFYGLHEIEPLKEQAR